MKRDRFTRVCNILFLFVMAIALAFASPLSDNAFAQDRGNIMKRKANPLVKVPPAERAKQYDTSMRIYLTSSSAVYEPGENPVIDVFLKNEGKETRYFKRTWTSNEAEGVVFRFYVDGKESLGTGIFKKTSVSPESTNPDDALRLDPDEQAQILQLTLLKITEGEHSLKVEYGADYRVAEPHPRNWWKGLAESNQLSLEVTRVLDEARVSESATDVIEAIHKDVLGIIDRFPSIAGYDDSALSRDADSWRGIPEINFKIMRPKLREIRVYFQQPDFQPRTLVIYERPFPYLGVKLFAHVDAGSDTVLRGAILDAIRKRERLLHETTRSLASNLRIKIYPFSTELSKKFRRAAFVVRGVVRSKNVETAKPYEYEIRKWIIDVDVNEVYTGGIRDKKIKVKSGTITAFFGQGEIIDNEFVMLFAGKNNWQKEYVLIGVEPARPNLIDWLHARYTEPEKK